MKAAGRFDPLILLIIFALALRIVWALLVPVVPVSDSAMYDLFAREIAAGNGYRFPNGTPVVYWAVGAPALYAICYFIFGSGAAVVAIANVVMGVGFVGAVYWLAANMFGRPVALFAAAVVAAWPVWISFTTVLNSELPFVLFLTLSMAVMTSDRSPSAVRVICSAALLTIAVYMRPIALPLLIALPLARAIEHRNFRRAARDLVLTGIVAGLLLAPWAARNREIFGKAVLVSANFGANLWMGNNPNATGGYMDLPPGLPDNQVERDVVLQSRATDFIIRNPGTYLALCVTRIRMSFDRESIGVAWNESGIAKRAQLPLKLVSATYWYGVLGLAILGIAVFVGQSFANLFNPTLVATGLFAALAILVVGMDRYHLPMAPFLAIFAGRSLHRARQAGLLGFFR